MTEYDSIQDDVRLSAAGEERKAVMLDELTTSMQSWRRRRRLTAHGGFAAVVVLAAAASVHFASRTIQNNSLPQHPVMVNNVEPSGGRLAARESHIQIVRTDPSIVDRWSGVRPTGLVERMNDDDLLVTLASMDRPTGLIRIGNEVRLTNNVIDAEQEPENPPSL